MDLIWDSETCTPRARLGFGIKCIGPKLLRAGIGTHGRAHFDHLPQYGERDRTWSLQSQNGRRQ